jgi:hypothetical protein
MGKRRAPKQCSMPREIKQPRLVPPEPVVPIIPILPIIAVNTALIAHVFFMMQDFIIVEFLAHCDLLTLMTLAKSSECLRHFKV